MHPPLLKRLRFAHWVAVDVVVAAGYGLVAMFGAYAGIRLSPAGIAAVLTDSGLLWIVLTCRRTGLCRKRSRMW